MSAKKKTPRAEYFVGKNIRRRREELGFRFIMDFWGGIGVALSPASLYEKQKRKVPIELLPLIATRLGCTIEDLFRDPALSAQRSTPADSPEHNPARFAHAVTIPILGSIGKGGKVTRFTTPRDVMIFDRGIIGDDAGETLPGGSPRWGAYVVEGEDFALFKIADNDLVIADHKPAESTGAVVIASVDGATVFMRSEGVTKSEGVKPFLWFTSGVSGGEPLMATRERVEVIARLHRSVHSH